MVRRYCDKCGQDITYYKDYIVKMNVETISNKVEYLERGDQSFDLCSKCWRDIALRIKRNIKE